MNDKELADKVVALGAGYKLKADSEQYCVFADCEWCDTVPASELVLDWRVAGALMEKVPWGEWYEADDLGNFISEVEPPMGGKRKANTFGLARAIIEACVKALEPVQQRQEQ